ncbi:class I SAM-dependent methyltransferase [Hazenella sp. IB182357]|uniref:Class I SAM-dependent methyltransferase n=1 Tax=Polycladospora coralii TaxID=2771432 RepID=A0A926RUI9_9BACL|nr:class I SAM-dependent methyltransferase [Polycladospora coralii]MBD1373995.1 class I SAM-dependent methyltransferase [Polycladospora coralii]
MVTDSQIKVQLDKITPLVNQIEGWLSNIEHLYKLVHMTDVPNIVEIGSFKGKSASCFAFAVKNRGSGRVYAVDHWETLANYEAFIQNLTQLDLMPYVEPIKMYSVVAAQQWPVTRRIGLLYIDASHYYHSVREDFEYWSPYVEPGGYIVFDDVPSDEGPTRLTQELPKWYKKIDMGGNQVTFQKL